MSEGTAKTKIVIDVGEGAKSLRTLKQEFKEAQKELDNTIVGTDEYTNSLKKLANVKDEIEDLNKAITAFRPDQKLAAFVGVGRGMAAGFEAATASAALFGGEAKDVEKAMLKVQAAMALSNAVQEVGELGKAFQLFGQVAKAAIGSTGIGLFVIALGAVVAYWDKIKTSVTGVSKEMENGLSISHRVVEIEKEKLAKIDAQAAVMKLNGASEEKILKFKQAQIKETILAMQIDLKKNQAVQKVQEETAARNKEILSGILKFIEAPINVLLYSVDLLGKALGKDWDLVNKFTDSVAELVFSPDDVKKKGEEANKETQKQIDDLLAQEVNLQQELKDTRAEAHRKRLEEIAKEGEERYKKNKEEQDKIRQQEEADRLAEEELAKGNKQEKIKTDAEIQAEADAAKLGESLNLYQAEKAIKEQEEKEDIDRFNRRMNRTQAGIMLAQESVNILNSIGNAAIQDSQKLKQFQKATALAQIAIDTAKAISSVVAASTANPNNAYTFGVAGAIQMASGLASVFVNIAKAKQILESGDAPSSAPTLGGGSSGGGVRPPVLNQVGNTSTNLANLNNPQPSQKPIKAYVVETDSTAAQKRISKIEDKTKF